MSREPEQLDLPVAPEWATEDEWPRVLAAFAEVADLLGRKELSWVAGTDRVTLDAALAERDRKGVRLKWIVAAAFVARRASGEQGALARTALLRLVERLARLVGCVVVPVAQMRPGDVIARYEAEMRGLGATGAAIVDRVNGRGLNDPDSKRRR